MGMPAVRSETLFILSATAKAYRRKREHAQLSGLSKHIIISENCSVDEGHCSGSDGSQKIMLMLKGGTASLVLSQLRQILVLSDTIKLFLPSLFC